MTISLRNVSACRRLNLKKSWIFLVSLSVVYYVTRTWTESVVQERRPRLRHLQIAQDDTSLRYVENRKNKVSAQPRDAMQHIRNGDHREAVESKSYPHLQLISETVEKMNAYGPVPSECSNKTYDLNILPVTSVIITFCDNERLLDILHTVHSIIQRTPEQLIHEIILVDDNTRRDELKSVLRIYGENVFNGKVLTLRANTTLGLIQARVMGAKAASGDVIVFLDAHMEVQKGWLEPLVAEIAKDDHTLAAAYVDWLAWKGSDWQYTVVGSTWTTYFDWGLNFGWQDISDRRKEARDDPTAPIRSAVNLGCNVAISRKFFESLGWFDERLQFWGGENIELSIKVWMCGGKVVNMPCSHIAHMERPHQRTYRNDKNDIIQNNYKMIAEKWFPSQYKDLFYSYYPKLKAVLPIGETNYSLDTRQSLERQTDLRCNTDFEIFLNKAIPELGVPFKEIAWGTVRLVDQTQPICLHFDGKYTPVIASLCSEHNTLSQGLFWSKDGTIRTPILSMEVSRDGVEMVESFTHHGTEDITKWAHVRDGSIMDLKSGKCLQLVKNNKIRLTKCKQKYSKQKWTFQHYGEEYPAFYKSTKKKTFQEIRTLFVNVFDRSYENKTTNNDYR
ncbi:unnamed protein product [Owenia fusiformis]|uniref:Polypeptide N-acetylgalactosaminyltransferase n=1 Tax=Owenia fusiformis TaxID=6347 RepID=A0A8J1Y6C0_OWEFU|nr:unnamed protein product [Owenia fusiformis]